MNGREKARKTHRKRRGRHGLIAVTSSQLFFAFVVIVRGQYLLPFNPRFAGVVRLDGWILCTY